MLTLTENAVTQIRKLQAERGEGGDTLMLRIRVDGGGCSGFQYQFSLDNEKSDDDRTFESQGVDIVTDEASLRFLQGAEVDYTQEIIGASFVVRNPNARSSCGCGNSFSA